MKNKTEFKNNTTSPANVNPSILSNLTQSLNSYEQSERNVREELDKYARTIQETDLKVDQLRVEIINQINQTTDSFSTISEDKNVSKYELKELSKKIIQLNSTLDDLKRNDAGVRHTHREISRLRNDLEVINSKKNTITENLTLLVNQEIELASQDGSSAKRQIQKIQQLRHSLEKQLEGFVKQINKIEEKLQKNFHNLNKQRQNIELAWNQKIAHQLHLNEKNPNHYEEESSQNPPQGSPTNSAINQTESFRAPNLAINLPTSFFSKRTNFVPSSIFSSPTKTAAMVERNNFKGDNPGDNHNENNDERKIKNMEYNERSSTNSDFAKQSNLSLPNVSQQTTKTEEIDFSQENLFNVRPDFLKDDVSEKQLAPNWKNFGNNQFLKKEDSSKRESWSVDKHALAGESANLGTINSLLDQLNEVKTAASTPSVNHYEFFMTLEERLNICREFLQSSPINPDIVNRFVKELSSIAVYFHDLIAQLQKNFSNIVLFKNDVVRLLPDKQKICDRFVKFQEKYKSVEIRKQYDSFFAFYDEFKAQFDVVRRKVFTDYELFNVFTSDLKDTFDWIRTNISSEDFSFWMDANELLKFWTNLQSQYDRSNTNANNIDATLSKVLTKIENKLDRLDSDLESISSQVALISNDSNSFANMWDESAARVDELVELIEVISNAVSDRIQELNTIFEDAVNSIGSATNTAVIVQINQALEYFYGYKGVFANQIKDFDFHLSGVRHSYEQFLNRKQNIVDREKELNNVINNINSNQYILSEWTKQCHLALENSLNLLKIFAQKIALNQQRLFATYNSFLNRHAVVRDYVIARKEKQSWQRSLFRNEQPSYPNGVEILSDANNLKISQPDKFENILIDENEHEDGNLMKKTAVLLQGLNTYKPMQTDIIKTTEIKE